MNLIKRGRDCKVRIFRDCQYDKDLSLLGEGTEAERAEAWQAICIDYIEQAFPKLPQLQLERGITEFSSSIFIVETLFETIDKMAPYLEDERFQERVKIICKQLNNEAVPVSWRNSGERFLSDIKRAKIMYRIKYVQLEEAKKELDKLLGEEKSSKHIPEDIGDFIDLCTSIFTVLGIKVDVEKDNVEEFGRWVGKVRAFVMASQSNAQNQ